MQHAAESCDDDMRNKEHHEDQGSERAFNHHNMHNPTCRDVGRGKLIDSLCRDGTDTPIKP